MAKLIRTLHPVIRVLDETKGLVEYIASDESIDSYNECVRAAGADFSRFQKNAPFVDSHNYECIDCLLGKVVDWKIQGNQVVETVQWAIDVPENEMAQLGFKMTQAGYLKAVSIGFMPTSYCTKWDSNPTMFQQALKDMNIPATANVNCIYLGWQQLELSACVIGANANAVAKAYKAGIITDAWLEKISSQKAQQATANSTDGPAAVELARQRARQRFLVEFELTLKHL